MGFLSYTLLFTLMIFLNPVRGYQEHWQNGVYIRAPDGSSMHTEKEGMLVTPGDKNPLGYNEVLINDNVHRVPNGSTLYLVHGVVTICPGAGRSSRRRQPPRFYNNDILFRVGKDHAVFRDGEFYEKYPTDPEVGAQIVKPKNGDYVEHDEDCVATFHNGWIPSERTCRCTIF